MIARTPSVDILSAIWVSFRAMCFPCRNSRNSSASKDVHTGRNGSKVVRVYAKAIIAYMVNLKPFRDWPLSKCIGYAMDKPIAVVYIDNPIFKVIASSPQVASRVWLWERIPLNPFRYWSVPSAFFDLHAVKIHHQTT